MSGEQLSKTNRSMSDDVYCKISWESFVKIILDYGFLIGYAENIRGDKIHEEANEEIVICYHKEKGLVLFAESENSKAFLSELKIYGEIKSKHEDLTEQQKCVLDCVTFYDPNGGTILFSIDTKKAVLRCLDEISENFELCKKWSKIPLLDFLTTLEVIEKSSDYKEITMERIMKSEKELKNIVGIN